jgi:hypothetical protein
VSAVNYDMQTGLLSDASSLSQKEQPSSNLVEGLDLLDKEGKGYHDASNTNEGWSIYAEACFAASDRGCGGAASEMPPVLGTQI